MREIEAAGGRAIWVQADVSDPAAVRRLFEENERAFGGVDVVVSNAGIMRLAPFRDMTDADFSRMVDVNQKGSFYVLREAARRVRDGGRIIALSSSITLLRSPTYGPYAATKAAQELFANVLAKELEGRMISVNCDGAGPREHDTLHRRQDARADRRLRCAHAAQAAGRAFRHCRCHRGAVQRRRRLDQRSNGIRQRRHRLTPAST